MILFIFGLRLFLDERLDDLLHVANLDQDVFGFQIRMYDAALSVEIIQTQQDLFCYLLDQWHWDASVVPSLDQTQQILSKHFENHANVHTIRTLVLERIEKTDDIGSTRMIWIRFHDLLQELDLIDCGLCIVSGGSDNLQRDMFARFYISGKPYS